MWAFDLSGSNTNNWDVAYKQGTDSEAAVHRGKRTANNLDTRYRAQQRYSDVES